MAIHILTNKDDVEEMLQSSVIGGRLTGGSLSRKSFRNCQMLRRIAYSNMLRKSSLIRSIVRLDKSFKIPDPAYEKTNFRGILRGIIASHSAIANCESLCYA